VPFDTRKLARRLESAGFPPKQAGDAAEALAAAMFSAALATPADLDRAQTNLKTEIAALRAELKADIAALRAEFKTDIAAVEAEIELLRRDLTIRLGGMMVVAVGIILAAIRYMPRPH
jgi:predicted lipoprotein